MKFLCWLIGHRWWLVDCGVMHKDQFECSRCNAIEPAAANGKYRRDIKWIGDKYEYWDYEKQVDVVKYKRD